MRTRRSRLGKKIELIAKFSTENHTFRFFQQHGETRLPLMFCFRELVNKLLEFMDDNKSLRLISISFHHQDSDCPVKSLFLNWLFISYGLTSKDRFINELNKRVFTL